jgi:hypothetical protein
MIPPHSRCNYILDDYRILIGAYPLLEGLKEIVKKAVLIVNLTDKDYSNDFKAILNENKVDYVIYPIKPGRAPGKDFDSLLEKILTYYKTKKGTIYIHCKGGHGRAATVGSILIGKIMNVKVSKAIQLINVTRNTRLDLTRNSIPCPETDTQIRFIASYLGIENGVVLPDRKDRSWLKK